jgi:hypothetical protein
VQTPRRKPVKPKARKLTPREIKRQRQWEAMELQFQDYPVPETPPPRRPD